MTMSNLVFQNGFVLCVKHSEPLQPKDFFSSEKNELLFEEEKLETYDVVYASEDCGLDLKSFDEVLVSSEGTKFRVDEEDVEKYGLPRNTRWAWVFSRNSVVAKVVE